MADNPRSGKKDQSVRREVNRDIEDETKPGRTQSRYRDPNRDQARGDWDRTGRHGDEGAHRPEAHGP